MRLWFEEDNVLEFRLNQERSERGIPDLCLALTEDLFVPPFDGYFGQG